MFAAARFYRDLPCDICVFTDDADLAVDMLEPVFQRAGREQLAWASADPNHGP